MKKHLLITGPPGCGKTTVIHKLVELLGEAAVPMYGFWTAEIREGGQRLGFELELLSGKSAILAHVDHLEGPVVSKYRVNVPAMDLVLPEIRAAIEASRTHETVLLLDEIGKMELHSEQFREAVRSALASSLRVVATVLEHAEPFVDTLKQRHDVELVTLEPQLRNRLPHYIARTVSLGSDFELLLDAE